MAATLATPHTGHARSRLAIACGLLFEVCCAASCASGDNTENREQPAQVQLAAVARGAAVKDAVVSANAAAKQPRKAATPGSGQAAQRRLRRKEKPKVPIAKLIANTKAELDAMALIWKEDYDTGKLLGRVNGAFQRRGYFSRIPSGPSTGGVESNVRHLASLHGLIVENFTVEVPKFDKNSKGVLLKPGERWQPTDEELFATIRLEIDLQGPIAGAAKMIDEMPTKLERLVLVTGDQSLAGGVTLHAECWFERAVAMPRIDLPWPELDERLEAAGWDPKDSALANNTEVDQLKVLLEIGRLRMVDVRNTLTVAADFPRWFARNKFFDAKSLAASSMNGTEILGTIQQ
jgi:hypothetical protein